MEVVSVLNKTGMQTTLNGKHIKPIRETTEAQLFSFKKCQEALDFEKAVNSLKVSGLKAVYSPSQEQLEAEGITLVTGDDTGPLETNGELTEEQKRAELAKQLCEDYNKPELEKMAEALNVDGWKDLNKKPLAEFIAAHTEL